MLKKKKKRKREKTNKQTNLAGKTLGEAALRREHGVTAAGLRRGEEVNSTPDANTMMLPGDIVYLLATQEAINAAAGLFLCEKEEHSEIKEH